MIKPLAVLIGAAVLEVGGDALMRKGIEARSWMVAVGAACLVIYGIVVNRGGLDFGRLMGTYIAVFFVVSQIITALVWRQPPALRTITGGALIIIGGLSIAG